MFVYAGKSICGATHTRNDDRVFLVDDVLTGAEEPGTSVARCGTSDSSEVLVCTFDGVGGSVRGDLAALSGATSLKESLQDGLGMSLAERLQKCADDVAEGQEGLEHHERAYTVGAGVRLRIDDAGACQCKPFHMGDCRVYRFRAPSFGSLTRDHSLANRFRDEMGPDAEVPAHMAHVVTTYAGGDIPSPFEVGHERPVIEGDFYLSCSDGLWEHMDPELVQGYLLITNPANPESLAVALDRICASARENGSPDDISASLLTWVRS